MIDLANVLPEDFEGREGLLAKFGGEDGVAKLARSYQELESFRGRSVGLPGEGADDEQWRRVMSKFGAPSSPDGYNLSDDFSEDRAKSLRDSAYNAMLTQRQFDALASEAASRDEEHRNLSSNVEQTIKDSYGSSYKEALARARRAAEANGVEEGWERDPTAFRLLEKIGKMMSDSAPSGGDSPPPRPNARNIAVKLREVMASEAYNDQFHGEHENAMMLVDSLRQQLSEAGYSSVFHPDLVSPYSIEAQFDGTSPWRNEDFGGGEPPSL